MYMFWTGFFLLADVHVGMTAKTPGFLAQRLLLHWLASLAACLAVSFVGSVSGEVDVSGSWDGQDLHLSTSGMSCRAALPGVMRAIRVSCFGGPQVLEIKQDVPLPKPKKGEVMSM